MPEPREVNPFQMFDKGTRSEIDFRPIENFPEAAEVEQDPDPKGSSVPEPVISSNTQLTIELTPEEIASVAKASTSPKVNGSGKQTSSGATPSGSTTQPAKA